MVSTQEGAKRALRQIVEELEQAEARREALRPPWILEGMRLVAGERVYYVAALSLAQIQQKVDYSARARGPLVLAETAFVKQKPAAAAFGESGLAGITVGVEGPITFVPAGEGRFGRIELAARERPLLLKGHAIFHYLRQRMKTDPAALTEELPVNLISLEGWSHG